MDGPQSSKPVLGCRLRPPAALRCGQRPPSKKATEIPAIVTSSPCSLRRFAFGWSRFGSFSAAGRDVGPVDPFWVFLALAISLRRPLLMSVGLSWISLDSLVRIYTFQWLTRLLAERIFPSPCPAAPRRRNGSLRKGRIVHGASLTCFLIFCKRLPPARRPLRIAQRRVAYFPGWL